MLNVGGRTYEREFSPVGYSLAANLIFQIGVTSSYMRAVRDFRKKVITQVA